MRVCTGFCFFFLSLNLLSLSQCAVLSDSKNIHHTGNSDGSTESTANPKTDFLYETSDNGSIHVRNDKNFNTSALNGSSSPLVASNQNNSNNLLTQDSGYQNSSQDAMYQISGVPADPQAIKAQITSPTIHQTPVETQNPPANAKPTNQTKLLLLDVSYRETTPNVILYEKEGTSKHTFTAYETYYIKAVACNGIKLWEATDTNYAIKVIYDETNKNKPGLRLVFPETGQGKVTQTAGPGTNQDQSVHSVPQPAQQPAQQQVQTPAQTPSPNIAPAQAPAPQTPPQPPTSVTPPAIIPAPIVKPAQPVPLVDENASFPPTNINPKLKITQDSSDPSHTVDLGSQTLRSTPPFMTQPINQDFNYALWYGKPTKQPSGVIVGGTNRTWPDPGSVDLLAMMKQIASLQKQINAMQKRIDELESTAKENIDLKKENQSLKVELRRKWPPPRPTTRPEVSTGFWDSFRSSRSRGLGDQRTKTPITIDINNHDCNFYKFIRIGKYMKFTCYIGFMIETVVVGSKVLWRAGKRGYAKEVIVARMDGKLMVTGVVLSGDDKSF